MRSKNNDYSKSTWKVSTRDLCVHAFGVKEFFRVSLDGADRNTIESTLKQLCDLVNFRTLPLWGGEPSRAFEESFAMDWPSGVRVKCISSGSKEKAKSLFMWFKENVELAYGIQDEYKKKITSTISQDTTMAYDYYRFNWYFTRKHDDDDVYSFVISSHSVPYVCFEIHCSDDENQEELRQIATDIVNSLSEGEPARWLTTPVEASYEDMAVRWKNGAVLKCIAKEDRLGLFEWFLDTYQGSVNVDQTQKEKAISNGNQTRNGSQEAVRDTDTHGRGGDALRRKRVSVQDRDQDVEQNQYQSGVHGMNQAQIDYAVRQAHNMFDAWNNVTGVFEIGTGSYAEILSVITDSVHCGIQMATQGRIDMDGTQIRIPKQS